VHHRIDGPFHFYRLGDIVAEKIESRMVFKGGNVLRASGNQAIHAANLVPRGKQSLAKVTSQKTRPTCDDNPHESPSLNKMQ
jgi:hypothetical protein